MTQSGDVTELVRGDGNGVDFQSREGRRLTIRPATPVDVGAGVEDHVSFLVTSPGASSPELVVGNAKRDAVVLNIAEEGPACLVVGVVRLGLVNTFVDQRWTTQRVCFAQREFESRARNVRSRSPPSQSRATVVQS